MKRKRNIKQDNELRQENSPNKKRKISKACQTEVQGINGWCNITDNKTIPEFNDCEFCHMNIHENCSSECQVCRNYICNNCFDMNSGGVSCDLCYGVICPDYSTFLDYLIAGRQYEKLKEIHSKIKCIKCNEEVKKIIMDEIETICLDISQEDKEKIKKLVF